MVLDGATVAASCCPHRGKLGGRPLQPIFSHWARSFIGSGLEDRFTNEAVWLVPSQPAA
jgi:hypothetical protein